MTHSPNAQYLHDLVDGFYRALSDETIRELYDEHVNIQSKNPISLEQYRTSYLRSTIALKLMDSSLARYFENLSAKDIVYVLNYDISAKNISQIEYVLLRMFKRPEYAKKFRQIEETITLLNNY